MERVKLDFPAEALIHRHPLAVRMADMNCGPQALLSAQSKVSVR